MAYDSQHSTATDTVFQDRVTMCVAEQAETFVNDDRPEFKQLAMQAIAALTETARQFVPLVAVRPGITIAATDGDLLAAVQYLWPLIGARYKPIEQPALQPPI